LPHDRIFGDGSEPASSLVGTGYAAGEGPGLFVSARDVFRVYLNGELVAASSGARTGQFVPLTLLPGDNALSVVVQAKTGTPVAWLQLDELSQSYVSDSSWKVSVAPAPGFASATFDDTSPAATGLWPNATDYGARGDALPGCEPSGQFPMSMAPHWIGPAPGSGPVAVLRKTVRIAAVGYGAGTTGGFGKDPILVNSWTELQAAARDLDSPSVLLLAEGDHDFRAPPRMEAACPSTCPNDPSKPQYSFALGSETCPSPLVNQELTSRTLLLGSNKTIVGLGRGAQLRGVNIELESSRNVILRNLTVYDVNARLTEAGDAFGLTNASQVWIDHCTTKWISDGFTDLSADSRAITLSWIHYDGATPDECDGQHTRAVTATDSELTVHHCFFDHVFSHAPRVVGASARAHLFNNLTSDDLGYGVGASCSAQVLMEGNTFQRVATPTERSGCADHTGIGAIYARPDSNFYDAYVGLHKGGDGEEPHDALLFTPPYPYTVEPAVDEWPTVLSRAGAGGPWALPLSR
jgi:pectate lyase